MGADPVGLWNQVSEVLLLDSLPHCDVLLRGPGAFGVVTRFRKEPLISFSSQ